MKFLRALLRRFRRKAICSLGLRSQPRRSESARCATSTIASPRSTPAFASADDYYYRAAAARVLDHIAVPTLILHALDDPFVRLTPESREKIERKPEHHL